MIMSNKLLNLLKLAILSKKNYIIVSKNSNIKLLSILLNNNFIKNYFFIDNGIMIILNIRNKKNIGWFNKKSKNSFICYNNLKSITKYLIILSTVKGLMTHKEALYNKLGGFIVCVIY